MPAILPDEEAVSAWLNQDLHGFEALKVLQSLPGFEKKSAVSYLLISPIFLKKIRIGMHIFKMLLFEDSLIKKDEINGKWLQIFQIFISWKNT